MKTIIAQDATIGSGPVDMRHAIAKLHLNCTPILIPRRTWHYVRAIQDCSNEATADRIMSD
jgi:hypothetical protein